MSASLRRRYHCDVKIAVSFGVVSPERTGGIPPSTLHRFRTTNYSDLVGLDYDLEETLSLVRRFAKSRRAQADYGAYLRVEQFNISVLSAGCSVPAALARNKARVISTVADGAYPWPQTHPAVGSGPPLPNNRANSYPAQTHRTTFHPVA